MKNFIIVEFCHLFILPSNFGPEDASAMFIRDVG
jgi:hypothetical protein